MNLEFLNINFIDGNIKKIIELRLLNFFKCEKNFNYIIMEQNIKLNNNLSNKIKFIYSFFNHKHLPNNTFFETNNTFINTEGFYKKTIKVITSLQKPKNDWQIIRKLIDYSTKVTYLNNYKINKRLYFKSKNLHHFKNFISFHYYSVNSLNNLTFNLTAKINAFILISKNFKLTSKKVQNSKLKLWIDDFYLGGKDNYSLSSLVMAECSKVWRLQATNFFFGK